MLTYLVKYRFRPFPVAFIKSIYDQFMFLIMINYNLVDHVCFFFLKHTLLSWDFFNNLYFSVSLSFSPQNDKPLPKDILINFSFKKYDQ